MKRNNNKYILFATLVILLLLSVVSFFRFIDKDTDNYWQMDRTFETDKEVYCPGDPIYLTIKLSPQGDESKHIKMYDDLSNVRITISMRDSEGNLRNLRASGVYEIDKWGAPKVIDYWVTKENYYQKTIEGRVTENFDQTQYRVEFPELGKIYSIDKEEYSNIGTFEFHGLMRPIKAHSADSLEDYFKAHTISFSDECD